MSVKFTRLRDSEEGEEGGLRLLADEGEGEGEGEGEEEEEEGGGWENGGHVQLIPEEGGGQEGVRLRAKVKCFFGRFRRKTRGRVRRSVLVLAAAADVSP